MTELWVTGMRKLDHAPQIPWERVLYCRLTGTHYLIPPGKRTRDSEIKLQIPRSVYFYLGRCDPEYGDIGIASYRPTCAGQLVSPFDTGGMAQQKIALKCASDTAEHRKHLVDVWSLTELEYPHQWKTWGHQAYRASSEYTAGLPPATHLVAEVALDGSNQPRAWMWEGRIPATHKQCSTVRPWLLILSDARLDQYRTWLRETGILNFDAYVKHMKMIDSIRLDPKGKADGAVLNEYLMGTDQW